MDTTYRNFGYNDLLLDVLGFSLETCLNNIVYGVETGCEVCEGLFNSCLHGHLDSLLMAAQRETEHTLGYALKSRYIWEDLLWDGNSRFIQLSLPNVTELNVSQTETYLFDIPINPFILEEVVSTDSGDGCVITVSKEFVDNPQKLLLWNHANGAQVFVDEGRRITRTDDNWIIPIVTNSCGMEIDVTHCDYFYVDVPTDECAGTIQPRVNNRYLAPYRIDEDVAANVDRYWFYIWSVVDPAFFSADFGKYEYYKLLEDISFYCLTEVVANPVITYISKDSCCDPIEFTTDAEVLFELIRGQDGIFFLQPTQACVNFCQQKKVIQIRVFYKVGDPTEAEQAALKQMIAYYVAAKLPLTVCKCEVKIGFISIAQKPYTEEIFFPMGGGKIKPKYGEFYGQLRYRADIRDMVPFRKYVEV